MQDPKLDLMLMGEKHYNIYCWINLIEVLYQ